VQEIINMFLDEKGFGTHQGSHLETQLHVKTLNTTGNTLCVGVIYSGEYDVCDVNYSECAPTPAKIKSFPD
jgi:hypothetical protein